MKALYVPCYLHDTTFKTLCFSYSCLLFNVLIVLHFLITKLIFQERKKVLKVILDRVK